MRSRRHGSASHGYGAPGHRPYSPLQDSEPDRLRGSGSERGTAAVA